MTQMNSNMSKAKFNRKESASTLAIVAMCALLIILAIVGGFRLSVYLSSNQEMKNSVDAGSLNVAKRVFEIKTDPDQDADYSDVADSQHSISLANINRVWGKAYLVNANAESIAAQGYGPLSGNWGEVSFQKAKQLNNILYARLTNMAMLSKYFNNLVSTKPAKLLGKNGAVSASDTGNWETAELYRGEESNLEVADPQDRKSTRLNSSH